MFVRPEDTSANAHRVQSELLRAMSPLQRAELLTALTFAVQDLAMTGCVCSIRTLLTTSCDSGWPHGASATN